MSSSSTFHGANFRIKTPGISAKRGGHKVAVDRHFTNVGVEIHRKSDSTPEAFLDGIRTNRVSSNVDFDLGSRMSSGMTLKRTSQFNLQLKILTNEVPTEDCEGTWTCQRCWCVKKWNRCH